MSMECPKCGSTMSEVLQSRARALKITRRSSGQSRQIRLRRRRCLRCNQRYTTREETLGGSVAGQDANEKEAA